MDWRKTTEYRVWRVSVIRRDSTCQVCGTIKNREAHHMNHATYYPEQRFEVTNGVTLCKRCHNEFHTNFKNSTKEKCTVLDYLNFKKLIEYIKGL
jgi:5-methylcytosine-specific restriction endonuclease McrA